VWAALEGDMEQALVNPQHIKPVPGRKNDRRELNCFERGFIPPTPIQDLRDLTHYRAELRQSQNRVANCIQKFSEQANPQAQFRGLESSGRVRPPNAGSDHRRSRGPEATGEVGARKVKEQDSATGASPRRASVASSPVSADRIPERVGTLGQPAPAAGLQTPTAGC